MPGHFLHVLVFGGSTKPKCGCYFELRLLCSGIAFNRTCLMLLLPSVGGMSKIHWRLCFSEFSTVHLSLRFVVLRVCVVLVVDGAIRWYKVYTVDSPNGVKLRHEVLLYIMIIRLMLEVIIM